MVRPVAETVVPAKRDIVSVLWCGNVRRRSRGDGWTFPPRVRLHLLELCQGQTILHLFCGIADFGTRLDIDPSVHPDVIGDAWLPPFARDSFDVVILDPPYIRLTAQLKTDLLRAACWIAKSRVIWFHTLWISEAVGLKLERAWLVRVGDNCYCRALQVFRVPELKQTPNRDGFKRGPAMKYNRWLQNPAGLPFG